MITNFSFSKSDEAILKIIFEELAEKGIPVTSKNVRQHSLFAKIDQKKAFKDDSCYINQIGLSFCQKEPGKFSVEFSGTGIDLGNPLHKKYVGETISEAVTKLSLFTKVTEKIGLSKARTLDEFLKALKDGWSKN